MRQRKFPASSDADGGRGGGFPGALRTAPLLLFLAGCQAGLDGYLTLYGEWLPDDARIEQYTFFSSQRDPGQRDELCLDYWCGDGPVDVDVDLDFVPTGMAEWMTPCELVVAGLDEHDRVVLRRFRFALDAQGSYEKSVVPCHPPDGVLALDLYPLYVLDPTDRRFVFLDGRRGVLWWMDLDDPTDTTAIAIGDYGRPTGWKSVVVSPHPTTGDRCYTLRDRFRNDDCIDLDERFLCLTDLGNDGTIDQVDTYDGETFVLDVVPESGDADGP